MAGLQIYNARERALVTVADLALAPLGWIQSRRASSPGPVKRVLLLRLERIGDLLMVLDAIADARAAFPGAEIDLAVGSWNLDLARLIRGIHAIEVADVPWLARGNDGDSWQALRRKARAWQSRRYDVVINFEPDIRSNYLAWRTGAPRRAGYWTGGGGAFLTDAFAYEPSRHVGENARTLIARVAGPGTTPSSASRTASTLAPPDAAHARAAQLLGSAARPLIGVHVSGGRESKQWHLDRFAQVARTLARDHGATIVLTGSTGDRPLVDAVRAQLSDVAVVDVTGQLNLPELAAVLSRLDLLVTGDTGPMHLASAVDTPLVALFGPSDPARYGPASSRQIVLRVQLPCSPCGQVRLPPERCRGHVPDCMDGIQVAAVVAAAAELLDAGRRVGHTSSAR
ncbi:MAG TPA: glycosyltransferase family 9 protein [Vicinamibacterales bacterium]|nr:glycosyltransferase family 9 protein [Vicinamibacterales bacterium]